MQQLSLVDPAQQAVAAFFEATKPVEAAFRNDVFSFVAVKHMGVFTLLQARVARNTGERPPDEIFKTESVIAGRFRIEDLGITTEDFLERTLLGSVTTPLGEVRFPPGEAGRYRALFDPFHQEGLRMQHRLNVLTLEGASVEGYADVPILDWHLRAATTPYNGLQDLLFSLQLGPLRDHLNIEAIAFNVMHIDPASTVDGNKAKVAVRLANGLPEAGVMLGYRVVDAGNTLKRAALSDKELRWTEEPAYRVGYVEIDVPDAAVVQCFASFNGVAQHFYWIADPSTAQNTRRVAYQVFDARLDVLRDFLSRQGKGQNARDLEVGVAWLLWLLGFSVANLGGTARTQDFADLIAVTPDGHLAVVECTTGLLKAENKLPLLIERTEILRQQIERSNNRHLRVLPIIVTSKSRQEVRADLEQAERLGVLVITREDLESAVDQTLTLPDADQLFNEAVQAIEAGLAKYAEA